MYKESSEAAPGSKKNLTQYDRRQALKKIGKFAAYTAPALSVLLTAKAEAKVVCCSVSPGNPQCKPDGSHPQCP